VNSDKPVICVGGPDMLLRNDIAHLATNGPPSACDTVAPRVSSHRFLVADGLRGIAALLVLFYHLEQSRHTPGPFARGYLAVDFFFMLSGFVMAHTYDPRWSSSYGTRRFLRARISRLWPTMALGIIAGTLVAIAAGAHLDRTLALAALALMFVPLAGARDGVFPLNGVQWSLFFELAANLAHAAILHRLSDRRLALITGLCGASLFVIAHAVGNLSVGDAGAPWLGGFFRVGFAYPAGILLHRLWRRRVLPQETSVALALMALPIVLTCCAASHWWAADPLIVVVVVPMVIWSAVSARLPTQFAPIASMAGHLSYPLYALHRPLMGAAMIILAGV
jgi:peptidoglycan/LPS O-acetylase OafA/YrhL